MVSSEHSKRSRCTRKNAHFRKSSSLNTSKGSLDDAKSDRVSLCQKGILITQLFHGPAFPCVIDTQNESTPF